MTIHRVPATALVVLTLLGGLLAAPAVLVTPAAATTVTAAAAAPVALPSRAQARKRPKVRLAKPRIRRNRVVLTGRTKARARVRVTLQARAGRKWKRIAKVRTNRNGRFRVRKAVPDRRTRYRAVHRRTATRARVVMPPPVVPTPTDACGKQPRKADGSYWECTFHDDFTADRLDTSKWLVQETWFSGMTSGHDDCYVNDDQTISQSGGVLSLTGRRGLAPFTCHSPYGDFEATSTAATVATRSNFTQTYGRFSFRAKLPDTAGMPGPHSALWLYPQEHTYGQWPHSGEIDVAEWFSARPENVYPSVHYNGENHWESTGYDAAMPTASSRFHIYTVEWTPKVMRFYYDGRLVFRHSWPSVGALTAPQPFDHPFYLVLTQVWGGMPWNAVTADSPTSATLEVDWVRAWK